MAHARNVKGIDPDGSPRENAARIVPVRVAELIAWERYIDDPRRVYELHQMRIAAKRLRYTLELFAPFYSGALDEPIDRVKSIQEQIGRIHDADMLVPQLLEHLRVTLAPRGKRSKRAPVGVDIADFDAAAGLLALCRRKRQEREEQYAKFIASWKKLRANGFFESLLPLAQADSALDSTDCREGETQNGEGKTRRRRVARGRHAGNVDSGPRPDSGAGAREGGMDGHDGAS